MGTTINDINFEAFIDYLKKNNVNLYRKDDKNPELLRFIKVKDPDENNLFYEKWTIANCSGGSFDNTVTWSQIDDEPEMTGLRQVFEIFCPQITYSDYLKIKEVIKTESVDSGGYYGDCTIYGCKTVNR